MKVPVISSLILMLGLASNVPAIERPKALDKDQPREREAPRRIQDRAADQIPEGANRAEVVPEDKAEVPEKEVAWLGVLSEPADETLSLHLGIEGGVVLSYVAGESPASNAGLRQHDVIVEVDGGAIANQDELRDAIQAHAPGDEVSLAVISKGERVERKVVLGNRPAAPAAGGRDRALPEFGDLGKRFPDLEKRMKDFEGFLPKGAELQGELGKHMKRLEKQLRELEKDGGLDFHFEMLEGLPQVGKKGLNLEFKSSSSFKYFDGEGSVEMKMKDGGNEVAVRDKEGEILFEGPWDTPQDKAAAPADVRERIEKLTSGNRFKLDLQNLPEPEMEFPEEEAELE